jgi:hypothetical protein
MHLLLILVLENYEKTFSRLQSLLALRTSSVSMPSKIYFPVIKLYKRQPALNMSAFSV